MPNKTNADVYRCYYVLKFQKLYNSYCKQYILYEISLNLAWLTILIPLPPNKHFFLNLHIKGAPPPMFLGPGKNSYERE